MARTRRARACNKKIVAIVGELTLPGMMACMPMTYSIGGKQHLAFTVGAPKQPSEWIALALA